MRTKTEEFTSESTTIEHRNLADLQVVSSMKRSKAGHRMIANHLCRPVVFEEPDLTVDYSAWNGLVPFAFWVIDTLRPRVLVELGTETGVSYCAFCQAVSYLKLPTACFAVDTWQGDAHTGPYGEEVFQTLVSYHEPRYASFSRLIRTTFDQAVEHFSNGSIDLLHIDGYHSYDAVRHDFHTWLPKLSQRSVVLFHDINVREMDFGVWRFWEEISQQYPSFSLIHSHGLGILAVGNKLPKPIRWLFETQRRDSQETNQFRAFFARLGVSVLASIEKDRLRTEKDREVARLSGQVSGLQTQASERDEQLTERTTEITRLSSQVSGLQAQVSERDEQLATLQSALTKRNDDVARLSSQVSDLQTQASERVGQLATLQSTLTERTTEITRLSGQVSGLQAQVSERDEQLATLQSALTERNDDVARLSGQVSSFQAQLSDRQRQIVTLQNAVDARVDQVTRLSSEVDTLQTHLEERDTQIAALLNSNSWRITRPLRAMRAVFRRFLRSRPLPGKARTISAHVSEQATQTARQSLQSFRTDDLLYSIDSLKIKGRRFHCFGWLFHRDRKVSALHLVARAGGKNHIFNACYPTQREDVAKEHTFANAEACGFWVSGKLPTEHVSELFLQIEFEGGITQSIHIQPSKNQTKRMMTRVGGIRVTPHRIRLALKALLRGDVGLVVQKLRVDVAENRHFQSLARLEDVLQFLGAGTAGQASPANGRGDPSTAGSPELQNFLDAANRSRLSDRKFTLIIDHNLGGGANLYRRRLIDDIRKRNRPILCLYYDLSQLEYIVEYVGPASETRFVLDTPAGLLSLVEKIGIEKIFLNNVYSFEDPPAMAALLPALKKTSGAALTVAIHDFLCICPSFTLLDETGKFCRVPDLSRCEKCLPNNKGEFSFLINQKDIKPWREVWRQCLNEATSILCFSQASVHLMRRAYPDLDPTKFVVRPHAVDYLPKRKPIIDFESELNIGIVGTISVHKGAAVVSDLAECIKKHRLRTRITIIGSIHPVPAGDFVTVTGAYKSQDLADLIEKHRVNMFLFPSVWPETFSYVTEELIQLEVPLAVYKVGAPAERIAKYAKGLILPEIDAEKTLDALIAFHARLREEKRGVRQSEGKKHKEVRVPVLQSRNSRKIHVFTGTAVNHLHRVRLLFNSIKQYHPEMVLHLALADKVPDWLDVSQEPFGSVIGVESLDVPNRTGWIFGQTVTELCTSIKPLVLRQLLGRDDCEQVFFFDADIMLFSRIDDLIETLNTGSIVLTPHQTSPESKLEAIVDNEICSLRHGIYNLGFLGVRNCGQGRAFTDWWADRLYYFCREGQEGLSQHLWNDQKWINHVPVFFDGVRIAKSSRFNVAPWNVTTRKVEGDFEQGFMVDGQPLAFYHFTGFDSGAHKIMAMKYAGENPSIASLIAWYEKCCANGRDEKLQNTPWAYSVFGNGEPITNTHRLLYRMRKDLQTAYPDPFEVKPGKNSYYDWFRWRAAREHPELFLPAQDHPGAQVKNQDAESRNWIPHPEKLQAVSRYELRDVVNALQFPQAGLLVRFAKFTLLIKHYWVWTRFHYQQSGVKSVLKRGRRRIRRMLRPDRADPAQVGQ